MHADLTGAGAPKPRRRAGLAAAVRRRVLSGLAALRFGSLSVLGPDGHEHRFEGPEPGPTALVEMHTDAALVRLISGGDLGFAEAYIDGAWDTPDLAALLEFGALNETALGSLARPARGSALLARIRHLLRRNTRAGSRRNIAAHYDLGNAFYRLWLDPSMLYSCADYGRGAQTLEAAQIAKLDAMVDWLGLRPGQRVLEIGCGWGALACRLAGHRAVEVDAVTLSTEQLQATRERVAAGGLKDRVQVQLRDYRDITASYDHIVSIEMLEAVGERFWPRYFAQLHDRLRPGGRAAVQVIVIADEWFEKYRKGADFIQRHIFPGGMLPSPGSIDRLAAAAGLRPIARRALGHDYARTLDDWTTRFEAAAADLEALGFDARFRRAWRYYFAYCRAGFLTGRLDLLQLLWGRP